jgi:hypothetical protein
MGESAAYSQYAPTSPVGFAKVTLSRLGWGGTDIPGKATVRIGPVGVDANGQPTMKKVTGEATGVLHAGQLHRPFLLRVPRGPWRVEVTIEPTFVPHELDHANGDARQLGAQVGFGFVPLER